MERQTDADSMLSQGSFFQKNIAKSCGYTTQTNAVLSVYRAKRSLPRVRDYITGTQNPITGYFTCFQYTTEQGIWYLCISSIFMIHFPFMQ